MIRPMTSDVSTLSGIVANGHQAVHFVSSAPSKIPYDGFSPVRLQTGCQPRPSLSSQLIRDHSRDLVRERLFRSRTCVRRHSRLLTPHTCPVALGSASGYSVRQPHRSLWPHPSFCVAPPTLCLMASGLSATQKVPTFICQSLMMCRRPYSDDSRESPTNLNSWLGLHPFSRGSATILSTHRITCGGLTKLQRSHTAAAHHLASPAPDGTFTTELSGAGSLPTQVGHDYRNVRFTPDRTFTGCSVSLVGWMLYSTIRVGFGAALFENGATWHNTALTDPRCDESRRTHGRSKG